MSSIRGFSRYDQNRHMNYIATAAYGDNIFTYTTSQNPSTLVYSGTLQSLLNLGTVTALTAPVGRILRTNGRKLFPGANSCSSIITTAGGTVSVSQIRSQMVGVIDVVTGISGFIDPNDSLFAIYNVDKAIDFPNDGANPLNASHAGPSVYTAGNVTALGNIVSSGQTLSLPYTTQVATPILTGTSGSYTLTTVSAPTQVTLSLAPSGSATYTLTGVASVPNNTLVSVVVTATTVQNTVITFASTFLSNGTLTTTAAAGPVNQYYVVNFVSNGTNLIEISRTAALTTLPTTTTVGGVVAPSAGIVSGGLVAASGQVRSTTVTTSTTTSGTLTLNPLLGQVFVFSTAMAGAVTLAASSFPPGAIMYVIFLNGGGQTLAGDNSTVKTAATATMTNAKTYTLTLVSNGTAFYQVSAIQGV
jgi:hypothetical protein